MAFRGAAIVSPRSPAVDENQEDGEGDFNFQDWGKDWDMKSPRENSPSYSMSTGLYRQSSQDNIKTGGGFDDERNRAEDEPEELSDREESVSMTENSRQKKLGPRDIGRNTTWVGYTASTDTGQPPPNGINRSEEKQKFDNYKPHAEPVEKKPGPREIGRVAGWEPYAKLQRNDNVTFLGSKPRADPNFETRDSFLKEKTAVTMKHIRPEDRPKKAGPREIGRNLNWQPYDVLPKAASPKFLGSIPVADPRNNDNTFLKERVASPRYISADQRPKKDGPRDIGRNLNWQPYATYVPQNNGERGEDGGGWLKEKLTYTIQHTVTRDDVLKKAGPVDIGRVNDSEWKPYDDGGVSSQQTGRPVTRPVMLGGVPMGTAGWGNADFLKPKLAIQSPRANAVQVAKKEGPRDIGRVETTDWQPFAPSSPVQGAPKTDGQMWKDRVQAAPPVNRKVDKKLGPRDIGRVEPNKDWAPYNSPATEAKDDDDPSSWNEDEPRRGSPRRGGSPRRSSPRRGGSPRRPSPRSERVRRMREEHAANKRGKQGASGWQPYDAPAQPESEENRKRQRSPRRASPRRSSPRRTGKGSPRRRNDPSINIDRFLNTGRAPQRRDKSEKADEEDPDIAAAVSDLMMGDFDNGDNELSNFLEQELDGFQGKYGEHSRAQEKSGKNADSDTGKRPEELHVLQRGVRLAALQRLLNEQGVEELSINQVVKMKIKPRTKKFKCSYAEWTAGPGEAAALVGVVNIYVSYPRSMDYVDLVDSLRGFENEHRTSSKMPPFYYFVDIFSLPQHPTKKPSMPVEKIVDASKNTVLLLPSLPKPASLQRTWCLFEALLAITTKSKTTFIPWLSPKAQKQFDLVLVNSGLRDLAKELLKIRVRNSEAAKDEDKRGLIQAIRVRATSEEEADARIVRELKKWLTHHTRRRLDALVIDGAEEINGKKTHVILTDAAAMFEAFKFVDHTKWTLELLLSNRQKKLGKKDLGCLKYQEKLGKFLAKNKKPLDALPHLKNVMDEYVEQLGFFGSVQNAEQSLNSMSNYANCLSDCLKIDEALKINRECLQLRQRLQGESSPDVARQMGHVANCLVQKNNLEGARKLFEQSFAMWTRLVGVTHPETMAAQGYLAAVYSKLKDYSSAADTYAVVLKSQNKKYGNLDPRTLTTMSHYAMTLYHLGRLEEAETLLQSCLVGQVQVLGPQHRKTSNTRLGLRVVRKARVFKEGFKKKRAAAEKGNIDKDGAVRNHNYAESEEADKSTDGSNEEKKRVSTAGLSDPNNGKRKKVSFAPSDE